MGEEDKVRREKVNAYNREYYRTHPEFREKICAYKREYYRNHPEFRKRKSAYAREYRRTHPERAKAWRHAESLPLGDSCEMCGSTENLEHHHPDYSKPDLFVTLCRECHNKIHWKR